VAVAAYFAGLNEILLLVLLGLGDAGENWQRRGTITGAFLLPLSAL